jgi:hypothetical protein
MPFPRYALLMELERESDNRAKTSLRSLWWPLLEAAGEKDPLGPAPKIVSDAVGKAPTASLSTVSLRDLYFGSLLGAFGGILNIFVTLSLLNMRLAGSVQQVVPHK